MFSVTKNVFEVFLAINNGFDVFFAVFLFFAFKHDFKVLVAYERQGGIL